MFGEAKEALGKAANAFASSNSLYLAGKCCEDAGNIAKDQNAILDSANWYEKAADLYHKSGKADRASALFVRAASVLTRNEKDRAMRLFRDALDIYASNDSFHLAADVYRSFNAYLIKEELYQDAINNIEKQIIGYTSLKQDHNKWKSYLSIVILALKMGDWVKATDYHEKFMDDMGYSNTEESQLGQQLLTCFEKNDDEALKKVLKTQKIRLLENQIARVALKLQTSGKEQDSSSKKRSAGKKQLDPRKRELFGDDDDDKNKNGGEDEPQEEEPEPEKKPKELKSTQDKKRSLFGDDDEQQLDALDPDNLA
jgi:hypothetical protein